MTPKIAVILFPGNNCEEETLRAVHHVGMDGRIFRWNEDPQLLDEFDGFILPGGWSYEDRIRAGVVASKDSIMDTVKKQAELGKPVLGICNGCQILIETNLVPAVRDGVSMALAPNKNPFISGYYCTWIRVRLSTAKKTAFTLCMEQDRVIQLPIAHGEGRFVTADPDVLSAIKDKDLIAFHYVDETGVLNADYPINPNGAMENIAGILNEQGNVMAMMPHPERAILARQVPGFTGNKNAAMGAGPGKAIFESIKKYIEETKTW